MAETIAGGCYKDAEGDGYHDANGKPVPAPRAKEAEAINEEQGAAEAARLAELQAQIAATEAKPEAIQTPVARPQAAESPSKTKRAH